MDFWGSAIGYDKSVARWNQTHSDIKINYAQIAAGSAGGYAKMQNAVKAGNAPCLGQVGYDTLPDFVVTGAAQDISQYANADKSQFTPWTWQMTGFGGKVFGIPVDAGPEALFYRADLFEQYGITPPKTWSEFAADAEKVHAANPAAYLTTTPQDAYDLGALTWQAGGKWFGTGDNQWQVTIDSPTTRQVADYWQGLLGKHLATSESTLDTAWFKDVQNGKVLSLVSAVWAAPLIAQGLPGLSGKWAVAPMPQWTPGQAATGSRGGSATVVLTGCKYPQQATEFADWLSTNSDSVTNLIKNTGIYPAATSGQDLPAVNQPSAYFGGQNIYQVFKTAAANISPSWGWGPTMVQVQSEMKHGLKLAGTGQGTIPQAVTAVQADTVTAMKSQGLSVSGG
ncbi:ABC transporter substrate-binding protein [Actinocrinis sp.]|uniref:ABC transporter substrate-binding protein n=1 Tax=Actinocrinis sp. TaxID=1920516 RepID=UPI002BFFCAEA|nr:extracellular solute-binding protein [Actinocrinis sp.]HXR72592.1 extracellular solute-binding protein [Actinocrinis sp.]